MILVCDFNASSLSSIVVLCSIDEKEMPVPTIPVVTVITVVPKSYFIYFHCYGCF